MVTPMLPVRTPLMYRVSARYWSARLDELPAFDDLRYTLTVADGCVLVRLGTQRADSKDPWRTPDRRVPPPVIR